MHAHHAHIQARKTHSRVHAHALTSRGKGVPGGGELGLGLGQLKFELDDCGLGLLHSGVAAHMKAYRVRRN